MIKIQIGQIFYFYRLNIFEIYAFSIYDYIPAQLLQIIIRHVQRKLLLRITDGCINPFLFLISDCILTLLPYLLNIKG